jgi:hypothetical protein
MGRSAKLGTAFLILCAFLLGGCGLIGGPFDEPSPSEGVAGEPASATGGRDPASSSGQADATATSTPLAELPEGCRNALDIVRKDVGQTICVGGIVFRASQSGGTFTIDFSEKSSSFFFIGLDWESPFVIRVGDCVFAKGKIVETDRIPSMGIDPNTIKKCPDSGE